MSLLLDALKRAEQEKLARQGASAPQPAAASPAPSPAPAPSPRPSLSLEAFDAPRSMSGALGGPSATAVPVAAAGERASAQQVFAAKRADPPAQGSKRPLLIGAGLAIVALIAAGGGYVWYQMQAFSPKSSPRPVADVRPVIPVAPPPATQVPPLTQMPPLTQAPPAAPPLAVLKPETATIEVAKARPAPAAAEQLVMDLLREAPAPGGTPPLKLSRSIDPPRVAPEIVAGYEALRLGDFAAARRSYQAALSADPRSLDATLGLATAEARLGSREQAQRLYRRALEIDARNPVALAGLAALADFSRPTQLEAQLKADLARAPESAALHFTLGNVQAAQSRWRDAQTSFFEAHRIDPVNADFVHNLAVSLDQLGQSRLAAEYYAKALALARGQRVHFDAQAVTRRIAELKS